MSLYIWPPLGQLPSFDPPSLAAVLVVKHALPDVNVVYCSNPDISPTGQLPLLTHNGLTFSTLSSIVNHVSSTSPQWLSHVQSNLGDLVLHMFYSLDANWQQLIHPALAASFPVPMRYYLPGRLREAHRPRLEAAGLWNLPGIEQEKPKPFQKSKPQEPDSKKEYARVFEREKVLDKARSILGVYARLLGDRETFLDQLSSLDLVFAAYTMCLLQPSFPDPLVQTLINESYPTLASHARKIYDQVLPVPLTITTEPFSYKSLLPSWRSAPAREVDPQDVWFDRMRYGWISLAIGGILWAVIKGQLIQIQFIDKNEEEARDEEEEEELEDEEELGDDDEDEVED